MHSTTLTLIGNVADRPSRRRLRPSGVSLTDFRVISTSRVQDRETGVWSDGDLLAVRVVCWRDLADRVFESVSKGDPVIVHGTFKGSAFVDAAGAKRYTYELQARALGHNLNWGFATFERAGARNSVSAPAVPELDRLVLTGMGADGGGAGLGGEAGGDRGAVGFGSPGVGPPRRSEVEDAPMG